MRARIHRGAHEVGGNCIELAHDGQRLVLDLGMPITVAPGTDVPLPAVAGLERGGDGLLGVVLSHPHPDHFGLVGKVSPSVPIYIGEAAARILDVASFYSPMGARLQRLAAALAPTRLVPIHSFAGDRFEEFFERVERQPDGTWWDI